MDRHQQKLDAKRKRDAAAQSASDVALGSKS